MEEFHSQGKTSSGSLIQLFLGDLEKRSGREVSQFMDREKDEVQKCQLGFIKFIVSPLFEVLKSVKPSTTDLYESHLKANTRFWGLNAE